MADMRLNIVLNANGGNLQGVMTQANAAMNSFRAATAGLGNTNIILKQTTDRTTTSLKRQTNQLIALTRVFTQFFVIRKTIEFFLNFAKASIEVSNRLDILNKQTGINTKTLQKYAFAMEMVNSNIDDFAAALKNLGNKAEDVLVGGNFEAFKAFDKIGITIKDLKGMDGDLDQLWRRTIDGLSKINNIQERNKLGVALLGKQYLEFAVSIAEGTKGLDAYGEMAVKSGLILNEMQIKKLNILDNQLKIINARYSVLRTEFVLFGNGALVPIIKLISDMIEGWVTFKYIIDMVANVIASLLVTAIKLLIHEWEKFVALLTLAKDLGKALANMSLTEAGDAVLKYDDTIKALGGGWKIIKEEFDGFKVTLKQTWEDYDKNVKKAIVDNAGFKNSLDNVSKGLSATGQTQAEVAEENRKITEDQLRDFLKIKNAQAEYEKALKRQQQILDNTFDEALKSGIQDYIDGLSTLRSKFNDLFKSMDDAMSNMLSNMMEGTRKWKDIIKDFLNDIKKSFIKMLADLMTQAIMKQFLGVVGGIFGMGPAGGGGGGGENGAPGGNAAGQAAAIAASTGMSMTGVAANFGAGAAGAASGGEGGGLLDALPLLGMGVGMGVMSKGQERGNTGQSMFGGALAGASMGMMVGGPWGALIGGGVGLIYGAFEGDKAKEEEKKAKEEEEDALKEQEEELRRQREEARGLITKSVRSQFGGGNAIEQVGDTVGQLFSGGISDQEIDQFGGAQAVVARRGEIEQLAGAQGIIVSVGAPQLTIGSISSSYDVAQMARDLGILMGNGIQAGLEGA